MATKFKKGAWVTIYRQAKGFPRNPANGPCVEGDAQLVKYMGSAMGEWQRWRVQFDPKETVVRWVRQKDITG